MTTTKFETTLKLDQPPKTRLQSEKALVRSRLANDPQVQQISTTVAAAIRHWAETIEEAEVSLREIGADELVETLLEIQLCEIKRLLKNHSELEDFLQLKRKEETEAIYKLSQLQKDILSKLLEETGGWREARWTPQEWFGATAPSDRAAFSTSLKRLEARGLVKRQPTDRKAELKRTAIVKLTDLGRRVATRLSTAI